MSKRIVITGSTKGIGYGLAEAFLKRGHRVVISGRKQSPLDEAVARLAAAYPDRVAGHLCDVTRLEDNENLFTFAQNTFGRVDIWINNAGIAHPMMNTWELPVALIQDVVNANIIGTIYGSRVAIKGMLAQKGGGWLYNLEGFGSNGRVRAGISVYGMTKAGTAFLGKSLAQEVKGTTVKVGTVQPGMVITDMVVGQYTPEALEKVKPIFNIIASRLEDVVPVLAEKILANEKNGALIEFLPRWKLLLRFLAAPFSKRNVFD